MMDSIIRDGLCTVGLLYLALHLWQSIGSIRHGIENSGMPAAECGPHGSRHVADPHAPLAVGAESKTQEGLRHGLFGRS
jgi:hypothetical protein